ncbi:MAG: hypothetical protein HYZ17_17925 [Betaproteobacteria bacterium]|nr:hypothetical protein [Betaproteobacteria bacterium]
MRQSCLLPAPLALFVACSNEKATDPRNSTATPGAGGSGKVHEANAQNATVIQVSVAGGAGKVL